MGSKSGSTFGECAARCRSAAMRIQQGGLDALIIWSRGGGSLDRFGRLTYLTNYYPDFPTIPDVNGRWRARGYAAGLLLPDASIVLFGDLPSDDPDVYASDVISVVDIIAAVVDRLIALGLRSAKIGIAGTDTMPLDHYQALASALPHARFDSSSSIVDDLMMVKSPAELLLMRAAGLVGARAMVAMMEGAEPGCTVSRIASLGVASAVEEGARIANIFAQASCESPEHTRDKSEKLGSGDLLSIDISGAVNGYFFDFSRSRVVGQAPSTRQLQLMHVTRDAVAAIIEGLVPGRTIGDATQSGLAVLSSNGHDSDQVGFDALGHGLGLGFERPWLVPGNQTLIVPGMCIAVERGAIDGSLYASHENDVIVNDRGPEIITAAPWYG